MKRVLIPLIATATLLVSVGAVAGARTNSDGPGLELEAGEYAKDYGVSSEEALRRLEAIPDLKENLRSIAANEEGRVAGWSIVHEPEFGGWIYLVGDEAPSQPTLALLDGVTNIELQLGATHTLAELEAAMADRALYDGLPDELKRPVAYREIDLRANALVIALDETAAFDEPAAEGPRSVADAARQLEEELERRSAYSFEVTTGTPSETTTIYGGEHIDTAEGHCTSGFAVKDGSTRGMLTAGHCGNATTHRRSRTFAHTGATDAATTQQIVWGDDGDSQWYTTSDWESDNFYVSTTATRDATGYEVRSNMNGDYVCHFGIASGYSCGTVVQTNYDPSYSVCGWWLGCDNRWVKVEGASLEACGGDSGGPWFNYRTGYGVQSGTNSGSGSDCTAAGTDYATFTAMDDILRDLDVTFATS